MRIILSRKGFDGIFGGMPSPILPDGSLVSLPIPYQCGKHRYSEINYSPGKASKDLVGGLRRKKNTIYSNGQWQSLTNETACHLDPDLKRDVLDREEDWRPLFGQSDSALTHLCSQGVGKNSLFLFFGWFKKANWKGSTLSFAPGAKDLHVIFGYLQVEKVIYDPNDLENWMRYHDHYELVQDVSKNDAIYVARPTLSFDDSRPGAGVLPFDEKRVLTKDGESRSRWDLSDNLRGVDLTYHSSASWKGSYFQSAPRGQEFVFSESDAVTDWAKNLIS